MQLLQNTLDQIPGVEATINPFRHVPRRILWGAAPTGVPHLGYLPYLLLMKSLHQLGARPVVLIANYHAYLDAQKSRWHELDERTRTYRELFERYELPVLLETWDIYTKVDYVEDLFEFSSHLAIAETLQAGDTTLAAQPKRTLADLLYVATQIIDVKHFSIDCVVSGLDEAPIYHYGLPLLRQHYGHSCAQIHFPIVAGLKAGEMRASHHPENKINLSDSPDVIAAKITQALAENPNHPILDSLCRIIYPLLEDRQWAEGLSEAMETQNTRLCRTLAIEGLNHLLAPFQDF